MSFLEQIPAPERRTDRKPCPSCEGSASGCRSVEWLRGRRCCDACPGDHDRTDHA